MPSKLAVQFYTLREFTTTSADFASTLKKVRDIGYSAIQLSKVDAMNGDSPEVDAKTARRMLDDHGLACIATHRDWKRLINHTEEEIEFHKTLGCDYVAIGGLHNVKSCTLDGLQEFLAALGPLQQKLSAAGIRFGYHNHSCEFFRPERHGPTLLDLMLEKTTDELKIELDLYWVAHSGSNIETVISKCANRLPVIHVKDMEVIENVSQTRMAPVGEGNLDWARLLPACAAAGVEWYAVEQDSCYRDPFDCIKSSFDFLSARGL